MNESRGCRCTHHDEKHQKPRSNGCANALDEQLPFLLHDTRGRASRPQLANPTESLAYLAIEVDNDDDNAAHVRAEDR